MAKQTNAVMTRRTAPKRPFRPRHRCPSHPTHGTVCTVHTLLEQPKLAGYFGGCTVDE